ncbi:4-hydroxyphenylpyruvate dioxygenase [Streptomyces sp. NBC_00258]|uniref:4-hydroxyphenylpyruvate dioxygenase n=1 Tax=Streptomyces sp. NBC_00258 TaxID=2903642 RepID=UPI002E2B9DA4|nr:4-hydroxyphenylpyruvate dioxygenase [Streptomyces sp. NBC_00258]
MPIDMAVSHIELYVEDVVAREAEFVASYGFETVATSGSLDGGDTHYSVALRQDAVLLVLTQPRSEGHPAHAFLTAHGDGVADIALGVPDAEAAFDEAVSRGARPLSPPLRHDGPHGGVTAVIDGCGGVRHTFVQHGLDRVEATEASWPHGFIASRPAEQSDGVGLLAIDHFAFALEAGELASGTAYYESVLGFQVIFEERIVVGAQAMLSQVVQSASGAVTLTLLQPDPAAEPGQIDEFVANHGGSGVQHVAFSTHDVVSTVGALAQRGVGFLDVPDAYYERLGEHLTLAAHSTDELRRFGILADEDHDGQLFQIFTRSTHPRRTFFMEVIERLGARTFGSGNIKALYEAVETERAQNSVLS